MDFSKFYFSELPFSSLRDIEDVNGSTDDADKMEEYHKHVSFAHLNTQSMSSTFDIFQVYD